MTENRIYLDQFQQLNTYLCVFFTFIDSNTHNIQIMQNYRMAITLREQETVLEILNQVGNIGPKDMDPQLEELIRQGEQQLELQYEFQANQRMLQNRIGINFDQLQQAITEIQAPQQPVEAPQKEQPSELVIFEQETLNKSKKTQQEIMQLDRQFPKLNYTGMVGAKQDILNIMVPKAWFWVKKQQEPISAAVMCMVGDRRWILIGCCSQLAVFMGEDPQPTLLKAKDKIDVLAVSPCKRYIGMAAGSQLSIYQIKKNTTVVLLKHFPDLKINSIKNLILYEGGGPRLCFVDQKGQTFQVFVDVGMILTKIKIEEIKHQLDRVDSLDAIRVDSKVILLAIGGAGAFHLVKIEPEITFYCKIITEGKATLSWRRHKDKISLLVASDIKLNIYRLVFFPQQNVFSLQQHLLFINHFPIETMIKLSPFHYLLQSDINFSIVALPLIPSVIDGPELSHSESALVSSFERLNKNRVIFGGEEGMLLIWNGQLQCGSLKGLEEQVDELMIQKCAFRQAFSLLVLVAKGINYSFKFTYQSQDLKKLIHSAVEISTQALMPSLDVQIVLFRLGWVIQLCLQCQQQKYMWSYFYPTLRSLHLQKHLFNMIQIFILKSQLTSIPQDIFMEIIQFYSQKGKQIIIQKLVLSNREQYEASKLLSLLNQKQMNYLQFYLFSRGVISDQHDFYTPFIRAYSAFVKNWEHQSENTKDSALLCYWILSKTFNFEYIPSGHMPRDIKIQIATTFFLQSLSKTFLRKLSDYNLKLYLQSYLIPFLNTEFNSILSQEQNQIMASFKEFDICGEIIHETEFVNAFLNYLEMCCPIIKVSSLFGEFYCTVLFLTKSEVKFQRVVELLSALFQKKFYHYQLRAAIGSRPTVANLKKYLINLIKQDLLKRTDRLYIKKLLAYEDREVSHLLHKIDKNYKNALEKYMGNFSTDGIFQFMTEIQHEIEEMADDQNFVKERKRLELKGFVLKNVGVLFRADSDAALEICYLVGETTQKIHQIMFKNLFWNRERILFLTSVLNRWTNQDFEFKEQYLLEHLQQVCLLPEPQMRSYLNKFYYPLDAAIKVADRKNNYLAKAILQMRSGLIYHAFSSYQKLIQSTLASKEQEQTKQKVACYIDECINICKQYSGQSFEENLWVRLIRFLCSFVASEHQYKVSLKVELQRSTQNIVNEMLRFLSTPLLITFFTTPSIPLPIYKLLPIYDQLFRMVKFDRSMIQRSILVSILDILEFRASLAISNSRGLVIYNLCDFCRGKLEQEHISLCYSCGHAFHKLCHEEPDKCLTCSYESDDFLFNKSIFKTLQQKKDKPPQHKKQTKKLSLPTDIFVQSKSHAQFETRKKRLKVFDFQNNLHRDSIIELSNKTFVLGELELTSK